MSTRIAALAATLALCACTTTFYGAPRVNGGPRGCWEWCQSQGMDLAGMVKMGEYSDGCICQVRPPPPPQQQPYPPRSDSSSPPATDGPAVAGVWSQMQAAAAQQMHAAAAAAHQSSAASRRGSTTYGGYGGHVGPRF
jgi:hypothetical protein